jgi:hypothetical protein
MTRTVSVDLTLQGTTARHHVQRASLRIDPIALGSLAQAANEFRVADYEKLV